MMIEVLRHPSQELIDEGNFSALIKIFGLTFSCYFIAGKPDVRNVSGQSITLKRPDWQITKNANEARKWVVSEVEKLGSSFIEKHKELYEI